jgi:hypothetical protein
MRRVGGDVLVGSIFVASGRSRLAAARNASLLIVCISAAD